MGNISLCRTSLGKTRCSVAYRDVSLCFTIIENILQFFLEARLLDDLVIDALSWMTVTREKGGERRLCLVYVALEYHMKCEFLLCKY